MSVTNSFTFSLHFVVYFGFATALFGQKEVRIHLPVPIQDPNLKSFICQQAFGGPKHGGGLENTSVALIEERFRNEHPELPWNPYDGSRMYIPSRWAIPEKPGFGFFEDNPFMGSDVEAMARDLESARKQGGQELRSSKPNLHYFNWLSGLVFAARYTDDPMGEYRVRAVVRTRPKNNNFEETYFEWEPVGKIEINPQLLQASAPGRHLDLLGTIDEAGKVIPVEILNKMQAYNLAEEMIGAPHSAEAEEREIGPNSMYYQFVELPEEYYIVKDPQSGDKIGYIVSKVLQERWDNPPYGSMFYRSHGTRFDEIGTLNVTSFRLNAHFDLRGNRVELWNPEALENPLQRLKVVRTEQERRYVHDEHSGQTLIFRGNTLDVDFGANGDDP